MASGTQLGGQCPIRTSLFGRSIIKYLAFLKTWTKDGKWLEISFCKCKCLLVNVTPDESVFASCLYVCSHLLYKRHKNIVIGKGTMDLVMKLSKLKQYCIADQILKYTKKNSLLVR